MTSDASTNLWVDAPCHDRVPSLSPYRQYSTAPFSFSRPDEFSRLVTGELTDWEGHAPDVLQAMKDNVERIKQLGIEAIDD